MPGGLPRGVLRGESIDNTCGAQVASKLIGFTNRFGDNGFKGDVCATSYDGFFAATLPIIDKACTSSPSEQGAARSRSRGR